MSRRKREQPERPDTLEVRMELLGRVKSGELTLAQAQAELQRIKQTAKAQKRKRPETDEF